jgi:sugar phosphate permease
MVGAALAATTLPAIVTAAGLAASFTALAGFLLFSAAAAAVWLREPQARARVAAVAGPNPLRARHIWRLAIGSAFLGISQAALLGFVVVFLHLQRRFSAGAAAAVLAAMTGGGALLRVGLGYWSDRVPDRVALLRRVTLALAVTLCLTAVAMTAQTALLVILFGVAGALATGWDGLAYTAVAQFAGRDRSGLALGLQQTLLQGVSAATPALFAVVIAATSWQAAFALLVPSTVLAGLCFGGARAAEPAPATV